MLATDTGGSEPTPNDAIRREVLSILAALGPHLLAASKALDGPNPAAALVSLQRAAHVLDARLT